VTGDKRNPTITESRTIMSGKLKPITPEEVAWTNQQPVVWLGKGLSTGFSR
jgi:hypothetical protein